MTTEQFSGRVILELMGHRRLAGRLSEREIAGHGFLQIDLYPEEGDDYATQLYSPSAVYAITPTTEQIARAVGRDNLAPIGEWELRGLLPERNGGRIDDRKAAPDYEDQASWNSEDDDGGLDDEVLAAAARWRDTWRLTSSN